jgi:glycosyltransferase involved in cell wall biosynthesis
VWLLARELSRRDVNQVVITGKGSELARRLDASGVPARLVSWRASLDPRVLPALTAELRARRSILHAHDAHALTLAGIGAALARAPLVATRRVAFPLRRLGFWGRAHHLIAISDAVRETLLTAGIPRALITVIPDAVDLSSDDSAYDVRQRLNVPHGGQLAVNLAALTPEKAQSTLVEAAALLVRDLPGLHWAVVGEGPLREFLEREIARRGLGDRFHLIGELPDPHVALKGADVFVLSSKTEGLSSAVLAAMAAGVPVVATGAGGVVELLAQDRGVVVRPGDAQGLAAAVRRVLFDGELRSRLTQAARQASREFGIGAMADRVLEVYRSCSHTLDPS